MKYIYFLAAGIFLEGGMKLDAYMDLNFFIKVQLIVENIICAVFAAVKKKTPQTDFDHFRILETVTKMVKLEYR